MEAPGNNQVPIQCRSGCGFYGTSSTEGMCSKCYKDYLKKQQAPPSAQGHTSSGSYRDQREVSIATAAPTVPLILPSASSTQACARVDPDSRPDEGASAAVEDSAASTSGSMPETGSETDESSDKKKKNRCAVCKKKVGLTGFGCRCGGLFCAMHRYSDKHDCSFDYRTHGKEEIRRNNPVIKGEKIKQI